jgi:DNA-binding CsgD family transcriptional regulator
MRAVATAWRSLRTEPARCRIVVITGEIGVGKSRLAAEAVAALAPQPASVLTGQARAHRPAPYDLTASALSGRAADELGISDDALAWLTQRAEPATRRFAPEALLRTAVDAIRALHRAGPGVLVVEDLHDLDPASLEVVSELAAAPDLPVLLLVTARTARGLAGRVLTRLCGTDRTTRLHLAPLTVQQVAAALPARPGAARDRSEPDLASTMWRRTGGNPFWLTELVATADPTGPPGDQLMALAADRVPAGLARVAQAAALLGEPVAAATLARFVPPADAGPAAADTAVDRLVASGVLRSDADGGLRFAQPILAECLAAAALPSLRSAVAAARATDVDADDDATRRWASLTARERDVVRLLADGMTNRQLARALDISVRTATVHVSNVLRKTGAVSRTEVALFALRHGVLDAT